MIKIEPLEEKEQEPCAQPSPVVGVEEQSFTLPLALILLAWNAPSATPQPTGSTRDGLPKMGRPLIGEESQTITAQKPWQALKMSRSTWYRRKRDGML